MKVALSVLYLVWAVYAFACIMNHMGVWPFSIIGN